MNEPISEDTLVHRATVDQIPIDKCTNMLEALRERRMIAFQTYAHIQAQKSRAKQDGIVASLTKRMTILEKKLAAADKAMAAVEDQINKARALALALEDEATDEQQYADSAGAGEE